MKTNYLEEKLKKIHHEQNPHILDDDLPDAFDVWLLKLDQNYILDVAYSVQVERDRIAREEERERIKNIMLPWINDNQFLDDPTSEAFENAILQALTTPLKNPN